MLLVFDRAYYYSQVRLAIVIVSKLWEIRFYSRDNIFLRAEKNSRSATFGAKMQMTVVVETSDETTPFYRYIPGLIKMILELWTCMFSLTARYALFLTYSGTKSFEYLPNLSENLTHW